MPAIFYCPSFCFDRHWTEIQSALDILEGLWGQESESSKWQLSMWKQLGHSRPYPSQEVAMVRMQSGLKTASPPGHFFKFVVQKPFSRLLIHSRLLYSS